MAEQRMNRRNLLRSMFAAALPEPEPEEPTPTLVLHSERCLPFRGPECGACDGLCPPEAEGAIRMRLWKPVIDPELCNGCGACVSACPVMPAALELVGA